MKISIEGTNVKVSENYCILLIDCIKKHELKLEFLRERLELDYLDKYDYERIMTFVLQHRRTLSMRGEV